MASNVIQVEEFGMDWIGPTSCYPDDDDIAIVVPTNISENNFSKLKRRVDPMEGCDDCGRGLYMIVSYSVCIGSCRFHVVYISD